jgi:HD-like signal output (HDOD) protein
MIVTDAEFDSRRASACLNDWLDGRSDETSKLTSVVGSLPSIALDVFMTVNSDDARVSNGVDRLDQALILLGSSGLRELLRNPPQNNPIREYGDETFNQNSLQVARAAALVARSARIPLEDEVFAAGLFLDIGTLILRHRFPIRYKEAERQAQDAAHCSVEYERLLLGTDHAEESESFLRQVGLPPGLTDSVLFHHNPLNANRKSRFRALLLHLGNFVANPRRSRWLQSSAAVRLRVQILTHLRLDVATLNELSLVLKSELSPAPAMDDE